MVLICFKNGYKALFNAIHHMVGVAGSSPVGITTFMFIGTLRSSFFIKIRQRTVKYTIKNTADILKRHRLYLKLWYYLIEKVSATRAMPPNTK